MPSVPLAEKASTQSSNIAMRGLAGRLHEAPAGGAADSAAVMPGWSATGSSTTMNGRLTPCRASTPGSDDTLPSPNVISTGR